MTWNFHTPQVTVLEWAERVIPERFKHAKYHTVLPDLVPTKEEWERKHAKFLGHKSSPAAVAIFLIIIALAANGVRILLNY